MIRKYVLPAATLLFCLNTSYVFSQSTSGSGDAVTTTVNQRNNNYYKKNINPRWHIFIQGGTATPYTDVKDNKQSNFMIGGGIQYRALYYLDVSLDIGSGKLSAGATDANASNKQMKFTNNILSVAVLARFAPLKLTNDIPYKSALYYISNLYVGTGIGFMKNKVEANIFKDDDYAYIGNNDGSNVILPVELGISLPVWHLPHQQDISLNINYRFNFCLDDKVDGYQTPSYVNERKDVYNTLLFGLGYRF